MGAPKQLFDERERVLALIPDTAVRIKVHDQAGNEAWRTIEKGEDRDLSTVLETDVLLVREDGRPYTMDKHPGRPRTAKRSKPVTKKVSEVVLERKQFKQKDPLLRKIRKDVESDSVLLQCMNGFADEAASLQFERLQAEVSGSPTSQISMRRIAALKAVAETWLKRKEQIANRSIDLSSTAFMRLFRFIFDTFIEVLRASDISEDQIEVIKVSLSKRLGDEHWEEEARSAMRGD